MGKIKQGILGGFSGAVGPVVGSSWKGKAYMRVKALVVHDPQTADQLHQRAKMKLCSQFASKCLTAMQVGYHNAANGESEYNFGVRQLLADAVHGTGTALSLDYPRAMLSKGSLLNPLAITAAAVTGAGVHAIKVDWTDNTGSTAETLATDIVYVCLYNSDKKRSVVLDSTSATRASGTVTANHPADWAGDTVQVYIFTHSKDYKLISESQHVDAISAQ